MAATIAITQRDLQGDANRFTDPQSETAKAIAEAISGLQSSTTDLNGGAKVISSAMAQNAKVATGLADVQQSSSKYSDFVTAHDSLVTWNVRMTTLKGRWQTYLANPKGVPDPFSMTTAADCGFAFSRTKTTAITLSRVDQLPGSTATNPETVLSVSVECTSPFTVAAGVAFSTLRQQQYGIQAVATPPASTTTVNKFVTTSDSRVNPLPIGMIHVRLYEPTEWFSVHGSFGVAGDIKPQSAGGSSADFILGPSIAFFRTMFLTPGLHLGRQAVLGGGYHVGDPVPSNITTPPLQTSYKPAFGLAVTFTKP